MKDLESLKIFFDEGNGTNVEVMEQLGSSLNHLQKIKEVRVIYNDVGNCAENCLITLLS
jgi:hypothetical protein